MIDQTANAVIIAIELLALATAAGAISGLLWLLPRAAAYPNLVPDLRIKLWNVLGFCLLTVAGTGMMGLLLQTAYLSELPLWSALPAVNTVLANTQYGVLWSWRTAALAVLALLWFARNNKNAITPSPYIALAALLVMIFTKGASGHGGDDGILSLASLATTAHITGACLWGGGIIVTTYFLFPRLHRLQPLPDQLLAEISLRLSLLSTIALTLVLIFGLYNAWILVGSWQSLWTSSYGKLLLLKISLVAVMMASGALNRYFFVPAMQIVAGRPMPRFLLPIPRPRIAKDGSLILIQFLRSLKLEFFLLVAVMILTAILARENPPAHAEHAELHAITTNSTTPD